MFSPNDCRENPDDQEKFIFDFMIETKKDENWVVGKFVCLTVK